MSRCCHSTDIVHPQGGRVLECGPRRFAGEGPLGQRLLWVVNMGNTGGFGLVCRGSSTLKLLPPGCSGHCYCQHQGSHSKQQARMMDKTGCIVLYSQLLPSSQGTCPVPFFQGHAMGPPVSSAASSPCYPTSGKCESPLQTVNIEGRKAALL